MKASFLSNITRVYNPAVPDFFNYMSATTGNIEELKSAGGVRFYFGGISHIVMIKVTKSNTSVSVPTGSVEGTPTLFENLKKHEKVIEEQYKGFGLKDDCYFLFDMERGQIVTDKSFIANYIPTYSVSTAMFILTGADGKFKYPIYSLADKSPYQSSQFLLICLAKLALTRPKEDWTDDGKMLAMYLSSMQYNIGLSFKSERGAWDTVGNIKFDDGRPVGVPPKIKTSDLKINALLSLSSKIAYGGDDDDDDDDTIWENFDTSGFEDDPVTPSVSADGSVTYLLSHVINMGLDVFCKTAGLSYKKVVLDIDICNAYYSSIEVYPGDHMCFVALAGGTERSVEQISDDLGAETTEIRLASSTL